MLDSTRQERNGQIRINMNVLYHPGNLKTLNDSTSQERYGQIKIKEFLK